MDGRFATAAPLIFMRHGETDWNVEGRLQGHRDIPLNERGRVQARRHGEALVRRFPEIAEFDFIASPLVRATETMEIVRATLGLEPGTYRRDDRLREVSYGEWEGFTNAELDLRDPHGTAARALDRWQHAPPGGESYRLLSERVAAWLATLERPTVTVAHGGVGRVLRAGLLRIDPATAVAEVFPQDKAFQWVDGVEISF